MYFEKSQEALHKCIIDAKLKLLLELQEVQASAVLSGKQEILMSEMHLSSIEGMGLGTWCNNVSMSTEGARSETRRDDVINKISKGAQNTSDKMVTISSDQLMTITNDLLQNIYDDQHHLQQMRKKMKSKNLDSLSFSQVSIKPKPQIEQNHSIQKVSKKSTSFEQGRRAYEMVIQSNTSSRFIPLGLDLDDSRLSKFLTFVRNEMIEIFEATDQDVKDRSTSKKVMKYQVGIRCRFCAKLPFECRAGRSANFPSSIQRLYQGVSMIIYKHFRACKEIPDETREKYEALREYTKKGDVESQSYWISSAKMKGMIDTDSGILLTSRLKSRTV